MTTAHRAGRPGRRDNGLSAAAYVPLVDVEPGLGEELLTALRRAGIPAYLDVGETAAAGAERPRLFVAADDRADARTVVASAARDADAAAISDPLDVDTDAEFAALVADWHVDTVSAVRAAERDLTREDADWRARLQPVEDDGDVEEHYVPPPPPPLPRLSPLTVGALLVIALSVAMLAVGGLLGLPPDLTFLAGVSGLLVGAGMLVMRLRRHPRDEGEDDDGAVL